MAGERINVEKLQETRSVISVSLTPTQQHQLFLFPFFSSSPDLLNFLHVWCLLAHVESWPPARKPPLLRSHFFPFCGATWPFSPYSDSSSAEFHRTCLMVLQYDSLHHPFHNMCYFNGIFIRPLNSRKSFFFFSFTYKILSLLIVNGPAQQTAPTSCPWRPHHNAPPWTLPYLSSPVQSSSSALTSLLLYCKDLFLFLTSQICREILERIT